MNFLINDIDQFLHKNQHGWTTREKAHVLASLVVALRPTTTVEIGVYAGRSAITMALAQRFIKHGQVIGIDPFSNAAAVEGYEGDHKKWWSENVDLNQIYHLFNSMVMEMGVGNFITLIRKRSDDVEPPPEIDLFHNDGQHSDQAVRDVVRFASKVRVGGIAIMDDIHWPGGGVVSAIEKLTELGFIQLYTLDGGAVFQRVK